MSKKSCNFAAGFENDYEYDDTGNRIFETGGDGAARDSGLDAMLWCEHVGAAFCGLDGGDVQAGERTCHPFRREHIQPALAGQFHGSVGVRGCGVLEFSGRGRRAGEV